MFLGGEAGGEEGGGARKGSPGRGGNLTGQGQSTASAIQAWP